MLAFDHLIWADSLRNPGALLMAGTLVVKPSPSQAVEAVTIVYTNYRGERGVRHVQPLRIEFGSNEWHPEPQWFMVAWDLEKGAERTFALRDIESWQ